MDLERHLRDLYSELSRLNRTIERLEAQLAAPVTKTKKRRGRKGMSEAERLEVSRRMTAYWSDRRAKKETAPDDGESSSNE